jgi:hypothetical protein
MSEEQKFSKNSSNVCCDGIQEKIKITDHWQYHAEISYAFFDGFWWAAYGESHGGGGHSSPLTTYEHDIHDVDKRQVQLKAWGHLYDYLKKELDKCPQSYVDPVRLKKLVGKIEDRLLELTENQQELF